MADKVYMLYPFTKPYDWLFVSDRLKNFEAEPSGSYSSLRHAWLEKKQ